MTWPAAGRGDNPTMLEVSPPPLRSGQVRVRVMSSSVNPADIKVTRGEFVGRFLHARVRPLVVGYDFSGVVESTARVDDLRVGDEVFGFLAYSSSTRQGAFAELISIDRGKIARKPAGIAHEVAAAAATPGLTALQSLRDLGRLQAGGSVLLIGAAGGVGSLAVGIAKRLGARVVAVCSSYAVDFVRGLGADEVVDRRKQDPLALRGPFDVVFDAAAAHSYAACRHLLGGQGAYITTLPSAGLLVGKLQALFSSRRCEFISVKSVPRDLEQLTSWIADGMQVPIDTRFSVRDVRQAIDRLAKGRVLGRLAVQVEGGF